MFSSVQIFPLIVVFLMYLWGEVNPRSSYSAILISLNYYSFEIRKCDASVLLLLFHDCFGYLGSFVVPYIFSILFSTCVINVIGPFDFG